jgi:vanillate O-demethylase ferredoxin subunit
VSAFEIRITGRRDLTERITEFEMVRADGKDLPDFEPGAHLRFDVGGGETRAYSLVEFGTPEKPPAHYRIAVQREPEGAGGSVFMHGLREGDCVSVTPPKCDFPVEAGAPGTFLAGGIGITPMISMAQALSAAGQEVALHYAGRSAAVMAYREAVTDHFGARATLHFDDDPATALDLDSVIGALPVDHHLYICGPRGMIDAARALAESKGIAATRVHVELFENAAADAAGDSAFEVEIASTGQVFQVAPGQSIIEALEDGGMDLMYDCQRGDCGICQTEIINGEPDHRDVVLTEAERASGKVMQICVSRAKSARLVLDL